MASLASHITKICKSGQSVLADFLTFLRRPDIEASTASTITARLFLVMWLMVISLAATLFFVLLALPVFMLSEVAVGDNLKQVLDRPFLSMFVALVVLGPLVEEMIFRGWLTGTYRSIIATAIFLGAFYGGANLLEGLSNKAPTTAALVLVAALAFLVFALIERQLSSARSCIFKRLFPYAFWLQGIVFGGLHLTNVTGSSILLPILATLPLIICEWIFAYARVVAGFGSAWLLHALYNLPSALGAILMPIFISS